MSQAVLLAVTYYNAVIVTENHLRFVNGRHIVSKRFLNVYNFRVHVY